MAQSVWTSAVSPAKGTVLMVAEKGLGHGLCALAPCIGMNLQQLPKRAAALYSDVKISTFTPLGFFWWCPKSHLMSFNLCASRQSFKHHKGDHRLVLPSISRQLRHWGLKCWSFLYWNFTLPLSLSVAFCDFFSLSLLSLIFAIVSFMCQLD